LALQKINEPGVLDLPREEFAARFNLIFCSSEDAFPKNFKPEEIPLIDGMRDKQGRIHSLGCVTNNSTDNGFWHIGGFVSFRMLSALMKGLRAGVPRTAARDAISSYATKEEIRAWGESQLGLVTGSNVPPMLQVGAIAHLCSIGIDVQEHAMMMADQIPRTINYLVGSLSSTAQIFVSLDRHPTRFTKDILLLSLSHHFGFEIEDLEGLRHDLRLGVDSAPPNRLYAEIHGSLDAPSNKNSAYGALWRALKEAGFQIEIGSPSDYVIGKYKGPEGGRAHLASRQLVLGAEIRSYGFVIKAKRGVA
ncbi:MAG: hypothetical protein WBB34_15665, partial [Xanthobacteraceae bacterium]